MGKTKIMIINGPNLNLVGLREKNVYGQEDLLQIQQRTEKLLEGHCVELEWFQSNIEGEIVNKVHEFHNPQNQYDALVINPGAYSHTSVAILDALRSVDEKNIPIIEVHLSNTNRRESYRSVKLTAKSARIIMEGLGRDAYFMAVMTQLNK